MNAHHPRTSITAGLRMGGEYHSLRTMITNGFTWKNAQSVGGEGEGETYFTVYKFEKDSESCYVNFDGSYTSYNGPEYYAYFFVEPKQKTITVYE